VFPHPDGAADLDMREVPAIDERVHGRCRHREVLGGFGDAQEPGLVLQALQERPKLGRGDADGSTASDLE